MFSFITLFVLFIFQPFGTSNDNEPYKLLRLSGYGLVTFCALLLSGVIEIALLKIKLKSLSRLIIIPFIYLLITGLFNHGYFVVAVLGAWHWQNQLLFVGYIFCIGVFPLIFLLLVNRHLKNLIPSSAANTNQTRLEEIALEVISLKGENKNDEVKVAHHHILFIKSADNYCEITIFDGDKIAQSLLRTSLTGLLKQLPHSTSVVKCHRSYAVNLLSVKHYSGNAGGLQLSLNESNITIPVSRTYVKTIKDALLLAPKTC
ncbi:LytTR family DNA-binding domain-containing protein [Pseudoalteromonas carrageenovora]|uniref:LytTR family DNA-binding domain-containing protein n=1 Tax=Pseudoalteromonas carrageenovora TaxID=227 RepID=UPI00311E464A